MIYDVLLKDLTVKFVGKVSVSDEVTRTLFRMDEFEFVLEQHKEQKPVHLISVRDNGEDVSENEKSYYSTGFDNLPEDCVTELAYVLRALGVSEFVWSRQTHRVNIYTQNNPDYIYSVEYIDSLKRRAIVRNPVSGTVFIRNPDEVSYEAVPDEIWMAVREQCLRLRTNAPIPDTWLVRTLNDDTVGFSYTSVGDGFLHLTVR